MRTRAAWAFGLQSHSVRPGLRESSCLFILTLGRTLRHLFQPNR
jgi:hypothetical protein